MRDEIRVGGDVLFYHSNVKPPGVVGLALVCRERYPDFTAWAPKGNHLDPKSNPADPIWFMVDIEYVETFPHFVSLADLKATPALKGMMVTK